MWQRQSDYARYKEKLNREVCMVNNQKGMLIQIKPDTSKQHAQFVLVSNYRYHTDWATPQEAADTAGPRSDLDLQDLATNLANHCRLVA